MSSKIYIDTLLVKAGSTSGVYLQGEVKGETVYMPLTVDGARQIAADLHRAAAAVEALPLRDRAVH
ncbi:hypothetical protein SAMN02787142_0709 [Burkholderia sp. WP9]|jgi:hypothetical protein|uniref:hypothetical protein n=1 Tax=Burkholderia sp. WP9 TaxID=1500263 RepID=UPI000897D490|nr:hypothetical protein [Burkholderia sp. WP9]SEC00680.1 hypothetical protein SAMN02787142_0709 [Burkholderia sp. WP9]